MKESFPTLIKLSFKDLQEALPRSQNVFLFCVILLFCNLLFSTTTANNSLGLFSLPFSILLVIGSLAEIQIKFATLEGKNLTLNDCRTYFLNYLNSFSRCLNYCCCLVLIFAPFLLVAWFYFLGGKSKEQILQMNQSPDSFRLFIIENIYIFLLALIIIGFAGLFLMLIFALEQQRVQGVVKRFFQLILKKPELFLCYLLFNCPLYLLPTVLIVYYQLPSYLVSLILFVPSFLSNFFMVSIFRRVAIPDRESLLQATPDKINE